MDFYKELEVRNLTSLLHRELYSYVSFENSFTVYRIFDELRNNPQKKVLIYGDYDVDGLMFALIARDFIKSLGCKNYEVFNYEHRTHELDKNSVRYCIQNHFDYFIIGDTASSDMESMRMLCSYGIKVIVLDHHNTEYGYRDYPEIGIVNTTIENKILGEKRYAYSAAALGYVVFDAYLNQCGLQFKENAEAYALVSLYSDCMDMSNGLNRAIYYKATELSRESLPKYIKHFMNQYQKFSARFIGFWFAPRINSMFRSEHFSVLNNYFFDESIDAIKISEYVSTINECYQTDRNNVMLLSDIVDYEELNNFVYSDLESAYEKGGFRMRNLQNYTGLVANKLSEKCGKTAIVFCEYEGQYKGSVRDLSGKNYLKLFKQLGFAEGHNSAFGIKIKLFELPRYLDRVKRIDDKFFITDMNEPMLIEHEFANPDNGLIEDIALYNEFSGNAIPICYVQKRLIGAMKEYKSAYYYKYQWGDYYVQSDHSILFGTKMLLKPIISGQTKLLYQK